MRVLMKYLFVLLAICLVVILVTAFLMWRRYSRHLHSSNEALKKTLAEIEREHEPVEHQ
jgi:cytochrome b subunit of formate dehydrogenase